MNTPRPKILLEKTKKKLVIEWKSLQIYHDAKASGEYNWPEWCYMPLQAYYAALTMSMGKNIDVEKMNLVGIFAALDAWRLTQGIYRYDEEIYQSLLSTKIDEKIPCDVFLRLPEWCVYIETPGQVFLNFELFGFFCFAECLEEQDKKLHFLLDTPDGIFHIPLQLRDTVSESLNAFVKFFTLNQELDKIKGEHKESMKQGYKEVLKLLPLVLYLCSKEPEILLNNQQPEFKRPVPKKIKGGLKHFDAERPKNYEVGYRIGKFIKEYNQNRSSGSTGTGMSIAPHIRKAHWHLYWIGKGRTNYDIKWLPPTPVNIKDDDDIITTIREVK